jgi:hemoglobin/transferrin/lactoferrin receptor protein
MSQSASTPIRFFQNKFIVLVSFTLLIANTLSAQKITVLDEYYKQPVFEVRFVQDGILLATTDEKGQCNLENLKTDKPVKVYHPNYFTIEVLKSDLNSTDTIWIREKVIDLDEEVVSASRFREVKQDVSKRIEIIRKTELDEMNQSNSADVLTASGNVFVQKSQLGGGSPVIRGFETNKVLLVVDGVPMNNAIYRGGHLQNVITIDQASLEKIEIVYGPGSVVYGSDALGGVMHFYTQSPEYSTDSKLVVKSRSYGRYFSAANGFSANSTLILGSRKWSSVTSFSYSQFDDRMQGSKRKAKYPDFGERSFYVERINDTDSIMNNPNKNRQVGSGYSQYDILQKIGFKQNNFVEHKLNFQFSNSSNISRYDRLTQTKNGLPRFAEWYYGPQLRVMGSYELNYSKKTVIFDRFKVILSQQFIKESRHDRNFNSDFLNHRNEQVAVSSILLDFEKRINKQEVRYGISGSYNDVKSEAFVEDIINDTTGNLDTRYPDGGSSMTSIAAYLTDAWHINNKWIVNGGVRANYVDLKAVFKSKEFFPFPFERANTSNFAVNGNVGVVYLPNKNLRFSLSESSGFRAPNIDDLAKVFESVIETSSEQGKLVMPNPKLKPEYAYSTEFSIGLRFNEKYQFTVVGYYTYINNLIAILPSTFNGSDTILYNNNYVDVYSAQNANQGSIYGFESTLKIQPFKNTILTSSITYTKGQLTFNGSQQPLDHIPPLYGKTSIQQIIKKFRIEVYSMYNGWKRLKDYSNSGEDNLPYATADGMPAWFTLNAKVGWQINKFFSVQAACENIFDVNYRTFASNISAPGRNWIFTLRINTFNK